MPKKITADKYEDCVRVCVCEGGEKRRDPTAAVIYEDGESLRTNYEISSVY